MTTKTCLDCVNLDVDRMPTPGHVCYECDGKLVAVKANGSNFEERTCYNCEHSLRGTKESCLLGLLDNDPECVDYSEWRKR